MVGAIFAIVRCSAELAEEVRLIDGRDDRLEVLAEDDRISSISSSDSSKTSGCACGSSTATHCSTNVLNFMCRFPLIWMISGVTGVLSPPAGVAFPEIGPRGGDFFLVGPLRVRKMLVSDFV